MKKDLHKILLAGVVATAMLNSLPALAQTQKQTNASPATATTSQVYRFATVIKTWGTRSTYYSQQIAEARADTQLIHSPAYPDLKSCQTASAAISQLLGADVKISSGENPGKNNKDTAYAQVSYKNSECMPSMGPGN